MALRIHALVIAAIEPLLRGVRRGLRITGADRTAGKQTEPGSDACTLAAAKYSTDGSTEDRAHNGTSYGGVGRSFIWRCSRRLDRVLAARRIVDLKLVKAFATPGHRAVGRAGRYRDTTR